MLYKVKHESIRNKLVCQVECSYYSNAKQFMSKVTNTFQTKICTFDQIWSKKSEQICTPKYNLCSLENAENQEVLLFEYFYWVTF